MKLRYLIGVVLAIAGCDLAAGKPAPSALDTLAVVVHERSRAYAYTNKESAYLYGETNAANSGSWQGFNVLGHRYLEDYKILVGGVPLDRASAVTTVFPDYLRRVYPDGMIEELHPVDSLPAFFVHLKATHPLPLAFLPVPGESHPEGTLEIDLAKSALHIARINHLRRNREENYPVWLTLYCDGAAPLKELSGHGAAALPALVFDRPVKECLVLVVVGSTIRECEQTTTWTLRHQQILWSERRSRMEGILSSSSIVSGDARLNKALAWAKLSLDALIMHRGTKGIYAGLPWFDNYWGRDTFISLPGAALVTGRFAEAKEILRSFAQFQQHDTLSADYGRIPNIVTPTDTAYNTADGTPRFVMMVRDYVERSGDERFGLLMYPTILRAVEGTLRYHTDSLGFLTHRDAETWMDAVGPDGPWSPRGNRANDVQALWAGQLEAAEFFATRVGDVTSARRWNEALVRLRTNFRSLFLRPDGIADRLLADGTADMTVRPNQLFVGPLLSQSERAAMVRTVVTQLTYPYGVASLWQGDDNFHPYHQNEPYYPKDAAYHNGTVWTWLQGPLISELCRCGSEDVAFALTENSVHQILDRGAVGTQSELLDAVPRNGDSEPRLSGTFSQAWNLAEFVRNVYDDYLGLRYNGLDRTLDIHPHLPSALGNVSCRLALGGSEVLIDITSEEPAEIRISAPKEVPRGVRVNVLVQDSLHAYSLSKVSLLSGSKIRIYRDGDSLVAARENIRLASSARAAGSFRCFRIAPQFATPTIRPGLRALKGPEYTLLPHDLVIKENPAARIVAESSRTDTQGRPRYSYPRNANFVPGSFEIRGVRIARDSVCLYFTISMRALSNPGWHPEYGFQLTFLAIAIDQDGLPASGTRHVGRNAQYTLDEPHGYEKIIFVGGGLRLEDARGDVLAAYIPTDSDATHPFGNAVSGEIHFAIPLSIVGVPDSRWTFTVLSGGQDDHGGAGIGEFRTVNSQQGEWNGGGKRSPEETNVYDTMVLHGGR
ncbi:MAG TPA: amylo-alpha-1,6-glucosidase [Bacteroidota bacterium]|nr:amylo-alpha-1,6-glucosidase [Bacteroidota bacterium]